MPDPISAPSASRSMSTSRPGTPLSPPPVVKIPSASLPGDDGYTGNSPAAFRVAIPGKKGQAISLSRVDMLLLALGALIVFLLGQHFYVAESQATALRAYREAADRDGDNKLSKAEIAQWFSDKMASGSSSSSGGAKYEKLVAQFDSDGDDVFDDEELKEFFDAMDEFPQASDDSISHVLGADQSETWRIFAYGMVALLVFLLAQLKLAIDQSDSKYKRARAEVSQSRRDLEARKEEVASREQDLDRQRAEVKRLEARRSVGYYDKKNNLQIAVLKWSHLR